MSLLIRSANRFTGCSNLIISQQVKRIGLSTFNNGSTLRTLKPFQPIKNTFEIARNSALNNVVRTAATAPAASKSTSLWMMERGVSVALVAIVPIAIAFPCKPLDIILSVACVAHTYWGFEAVISEYVRPILFGTVLPKVLHVALVGLMVTTLGGLFYLIFNDIGLGATIKRFWAIKSS